MANLQNKEGKEVQTLTAVGAVIMTRNMLKKTVEPNEFVPKIRRFNFMQRVSAVAGMIGTHMEAATIGSDGFGDWLPVATDMKKLGWFSDKSDAEIALLMRESWMEMIDPQNKAGGFDPEELFGPITLPENMPMPDISDCGSCGEDCSPDCEEDEAEPE